MDFPRVTASKKKRAKKSVRRPSVKQKAAAADSANESDLEPLSQMVCDRVRALRSKKGWTLQQLAETSGVSRSMLSQIERGAANPTLAVAYRIAQAFGLSLGDLVDTPAETRKIDVIKAADRSFLFRNDSQCRIRTLSPLHLEKDVEFYELTLKKGGVLKSAPHFAGTREFVTLEKGAVRVVSGEEANELGKGDSAHYPADIPHRIENLGRAEAVAFLVVIYDGSSRG